MLHRLATTWHCTLGEGLVVVGLRKVLQKLFGKAWVFEEQQ